MTATIIEGAIGVAGLAVFGAGMLHLHPSPSRSPAGQGDAERRGIFAALIGLTILVLAMALLASGELT